MPITVALTVFIYGGLAVPMSSRAVQAAAQPSTAIRVLSTTSGSQGEERGGQYVVLDPRTIFKIPSDTQVIVSFQWLGTPGKHQMSGTWKGPGGLSVSSAFEYVATSRDFGAYWTLPLTANVPLGSWSFEAQVDGQPAGTHSFEITGADGTVPAAPPKTALPLTRTEMLTRVLAAAVNVEAVDASGRVLDQGPGTLLSEHTVATAFRIVNGAARIRVRTSKGGSVEISDLLAYDRHRDWPCSKRAA